MAVEQKPGKLSVTDGTTTNKTTKRKKERKTNGVVGGAVGGAVGGNRGVGGGLGIRSLVTARLSPEAISATVAMAIGNGRQTMPLMRSVHSRR